MNSKVNHLLSKATLFRCPLCHISLEPRGSSLICKNNHTFNVAKKGHVNFVPGQKPLKYTQELFLARGRVFDQGFYAPALEKIQTIIETYQKEQNLSSLNIVDVGCGQGYYSKVLASNPNHTVIGFDLSTDAIALAASGAHQALFMVADLTNIPLADESQDIILDILTQANYKEFQRILKPDGLIIKVIPGEEYLIEIRRLLAGSIQKDNHSDQSVIQHFQAHHKLNETTGTHYTLPVDSNQAMDFLQMTPMTLHVDLDKIPRQELKQVTLDLKILIGTS